MDHSINNGAASGDGDLLRYINLKLGALGQPMNSHVMDASFLDITRPLLRNHLEKNRVLSDYLCPVDKRIQTFLDSYLSDSGVPVARFPSSTFVLDRPGLARLLSLPPDSDQFTSRYLHSYRVRQGVLHNPVNDRRTTQGVFHIAEGGLPIPDDKIGVPKAVFARIWAAAFRPPADLLTFPFTANQPDQARTFVSLLLRPVVVPASAFSDELSMEIRFFAPGNCVCNLDFVEGIFGNGGDPFLPENDAALDCERWTGNTGCVILAPHLTLLTKKELGVPHYNDATERQRRDGMCWSSPDELYNNGQAFKVTCRDERGVMVTVIADNYFGYCKKEVKTQISFSANLFGLAEEEHSGGAVAFPSYILGQDFSSDRYPIPTNRTFADVVRLLSSRINVKPQGYALDRRFPTIVYVPEDARFSVREASIVWHRNGISQSIKLLADQVYILPSGYKLRLERQIGGTTWRLVGSIAEGTLCHKPCTVSGGGKSEISKSIGNAMLQGPVFVRDFAGEIDEAEKIIKRDYSNCLRVPQPSARTDRPILSAERSLGSVVKLLTPSPEYTDEHNAWVLQIPQTVRQFVFVVKRYHRPEWGDNWREHFSVDRINGFLGHELKFDGRKLIANYLRVGFDRDGAWRIAKIRPDFNPADKVQVEDDITASVVVPRQTLLGVDPEYQNPSMKLVHNCERLLFQRPDDAIHRGFDKQAEADLASNGVFLSNFEPLDEVEVREIVDHVTEFDRYSEPMKSLLKDFLSYPHPSYVVASSNPRLVDGKPSKNPRYLQQRPDLVNARDTYVAEVGTRLFLGVSDDKRMAFPVHAVLAGRRNNPADPKSGVPPLAVYNPIHYQELPELFMDFVCSLTGKSPSTTGFGSEGALTKGPFNALWPVVDLNNALVSAILTEYPGFTTAAGYVGPDIRVDHDISLLIPEIWSRMKVWERDPAYLIREGCLEKLADYTHNGRPVMASRLGYRITSRFVDRFLARIFEAPGNVFTDELLKPESQNPDVFAQGIEEIVKAQREVARHYFNDGSVDAACPPLRALLFIMAEGSYEGRSINDPAVRKLFSRQALLDSGWYKQRLKTKQNRDVALWKRHIASLEDFSRFADRFGDSFDVAERLPRARHRLALVSNSSYLDSLVGTIGADPFDKQVTAAESRSAASAVNV